MAQHLKARLQPEQKRQPPKTQRARGSNMPDTSSMSQEELDRWSDINNPNNDADMDTWADIHNPNNDDYIGDEE